MEIIQKNLELVFEEIVKISLMEKCIFMVTFWPWKSLFKELLSCGITEIKWDAFLGVEIWLWPQIQSQKVNSFPFVEFYS